jgi:phosphatidylinositol alpha-1,6-mannosyltransferase
MIRALALVRARVPDVQWVVIGAGPRREQFERLAEIYGVGPCARFLGQVANEERDGWLERAHLFAMPSRVPGGGLGGEGFGIVYLEASWRGLPVVAGNIGGAVDAVVDGETGLLVDANDPVDVADAVTRLLLDQELSRRLGERGAARAQEFAWPIISHRVEELLLSLTRSG